jgi:hypothetical protein
MNEREESGQGERGSSPTASLLRAIADAIAASAGPKASLNAGQQSSGWERPGKLGLRGPIRSDSRLLSPGIAPIKIGESRIPLSVFTWQLAVEVSVGAVESEPKIGIGSDLW